MSNIPDMSARRVPAVGLVGVLALLLQGSAAAVQTHPFNKLNPATGIETAAAVMVKSSRPLAAALDSDGNSGSGDTNGSSKRLKKAVKHYQSAGQASESNDIDGAVAEYRNALEDDPDEPYWHLALAIALKRKGDRQGILDDYEVARKLAPNDLALQSAYDSLLASAAGGQAQAGGTPGEAIGAIHKVGADVSPPSCAHCPDPRYTKKARAAKYQATCVVQIIVNAVGDVVNVQVVKPVVSDSMKTPLTLSVLGSFVPPCVRVFR